MKDERGKRWVFVSAKPASDGHQKQLSDGWMPVLAVIAAVMRKWHQATGIETLLLDRPRLVRRAKEILKEERYTLKRTVVRERYEKPKGSVICNRDYRIAVADAAQTYAKAAEHWVASLSNTSSRLGMPDVWQWIADQATSSSSHLSIRLRTAGYTDLADAELDRSEGWWRNQLAKKKAFISLKQRLRVI